MAKTEDRSLDNLIRGSEELIRDLDTAGGRGGGRRAPGRGAGPDRCAGGGSP